MGRRWGGQAHGVAVHAGPSVCREVASRDLGLGDICSFWWFEGGLKCKWGGWLGASLEQKTQP